MQKNFAQNWVHKQRSKRVINAIAHVLLYSSAKYGLCGQGIIVDLDKSDFLQSH